MATAGEDGTVGFWNSATGRELGFIDGFSGEVTSLQFDATDAYLFTLDGSGRLSKWEISFAEIPDQRLVTANELWSTNVGQQSMFSTHSVLPNLAIYGNRSLVQLVSKADGKEVASFEYEESVVSLTLIDSISHSVVTKSGKLILQNANRQSILVDSDFVKSVTSNPITKLMASVGSKAVQLWSTSHEVPFSVFSLAQSETGAAHVELSNQGRVIAVNTTGEVSIWDIGSLRKELDRRSLGW